MATSIQQEHSLPIPSGAGKKIGIVVSTYNSNITRKLVSGCRETLLSHDVKEEDIRVIQVPGAFELPMGARILLGRDRLDAVICIGCVIKGETKHDEYISQAISVGIMQLSLTSNTPIIFGVLTPNSLEQAAARSGGTLGNKGIEAAEAALHMINLKSEGGGSSQRIGFAP